MERVEKGKGLVAQAEDIFGIFALRATSGWLFSWVLDFCWVELCYPLLAVLLFQMEDALFLGHDGLFHLKKVVGERVRGSEVQGGKCGNGEFIEGQ